MPNDMNYPKWMRDFMEGDAVKQRERERQSEEWRREERAEQERIRRSFDEYWQYIDAATLKTIRDGVRGFGSFTEENGLTAAQNAYVDKWISDQNGTPEQEESWRRILEKKYQKENAR